MRNNILRAVAAALLIGGVAVSPIRAQSDGPITLLVGYSAGGSADFAARLIAPELSERLGRPVVVENATGASGMIALQKLINADADGSTLYYGGFDTVAVPLVNSKVGIDWKTATIPVARTAMTSMAIVVPAASPYQTLADLVAAAGADPETIAFGTPGIGSAQHFVGEMISKQSGVTFMHVPYQGGSQVSNDLLSGLLDSATLTTSTALPFVKDGKVRALAVTSAERSPALPDVPALSEIEGFGGLALPLWQGLFVKAGTPDDFVTEVSSAITDALAEPEVQKSLADAGFSAAPLEPVEFNAFMDTQAEVYRKIVDEASIKAE